MKDIKFRAWDRKKKQFDTCRNGGRCLSFGMDYRGIHSLSREGYKIYQQYTGLKDKNGKEIYEGDIVRAIFNSSVHKVEWRNDQSQWSIGGFGQWEVIGNIYENPELLDKEVI